MIEFFISPAMQRSPMLTKNKTDFKSSLSSRPSTNISERKNHTNRSKFFDELSHYYSSIHVKSPYEDSYLKTKSLQHSSSSHRLNSPRDVHETLPAIFKNLNQAKTKLQSLTQKICSQPKAQLTEDLNKHENHIEDGKVTDSEDEGNASIKNKKSDKIQVFDSNSVSNTSRSSRNVGEPVENKDFNDIKPKKIPLEIPKINSEKLTPHIASIKALEVTSSKRGTIVANNSSKDLFSEKNKKIAALINNNLLLPQFCEPIFEKIKQEKKKLDSIRNKINERRRENEEIKKKIELLTNTDDLSEGFKKLNQLLAEIEILKANKKSQDEENMMLQSMLIARTHDMHIIKSPIVAQGTKMPQLDKVIEKEVVQLNERAKLINDLATQIEKTSEKNNEIKTLVKLSIKDKGREESQEAKMKRLIEIEINGKKKIRDLEEKEKQYKERRYKREKTKLDEFKIFERQNLMQILQEKKDEFNNIKKTSRKFSNMTELKAYFEYIKDSAILLNNLRDQFITEISDRKENLNYLKNKLDKLREINNSGITPGDREILLTDYLDHFHCDLEFKNTDISLFNLERKQKHLGEIIRAIESLVSLLILYCQGENCIIKDDTSFELIFNKIKNFTINRGNISTCLQQISDLILFITKRKRKSQIEEDDFPSSPLKRSFLVDAALQKRKYKTDLNIEFMKIDDI